MTSPADHRYLQVARTLRKEIVDGVYPVGSQLPTEHELCERFAVSRYTVREALRRLRDDNLVSSRPRAGTMVVPRAAPNSYAQDNMSINDLLAFASGAELDIESNAMVTVDAELAARTGLPEGEEWLAVRGFRQADDAEYTASAGPSTTSTARSPPSAGCCSDTPARSSRSSRTCSASASSRCTRRSAPCWSRPNSPTRLEVDAGTRGARDAPHVQDLRRRGRPGHHQHPSRVAVPALDDDAPGQGLTGDEDDDATTDAYARGLWVDTTLADALRDAAPRHPGPNRAASTATFD